MSKKDHYVDNDDLLAEMIHYRTEYLKWKNGEIKERPRASEKIGIAILSISQRLATKPNFANYTFREEMISDGIENCLQYLANFDSAKSSNPFAYFTQIIYYAFLRRIKKEKMQSFIKMKLFENADRDRRAILNDGPADTNNPYAAKFNLTDLDVANLEGKKEKPVKKKKPAKKKKKTGLDEFLED
jgi:hypothetical protein